MEADAAAPRAAVEARMSGLLQPTHLLLVFAVILLVFGPRRLPQLGKSIGTAIQVFKSSARAGEDDGPPDDTVMARPADEPADRADRQRAP
jgi:sec-independent protein translocase protein TatA